MTAFGVLCGKIYILLKNLIASSAVQLKSPLGIILI